jgi:hypothetical protein
MRVEYHWEDLLIVAAAASLVASVTFSGLPANYQIAVDVNVVAALVAAGKTFGVRIGMRSSFWRSQFTPAEWIMMVATLMYLTVVVLSPVVTNAGVRHHGSP